ncbi:iminosuccinate reductase BhcD [Hongsoonwoonella zoysiae]|uniref:iminosuccinate reductase BhcD n=1 Tax=Hongsoonwoonella zoysiae TaxID=2821844 RepID=UPI0031B613C0
MLIMSEEICEELVGRQDAFEAVEGVFAAMARGEARNFPVVREALGHADALYGFKSGFDRSGMVLGVKSGGYWPGNAARGLTNHQSAVLLFDPDTGRLKAVVGGNYLTAVRTAAASAVSIAHLAREDVKVLGIVGAGHQSAFQLRAAAEMRGFEKVVAWNRSPDKLEYLSSVAAELGLSFESVTLKELGRQADVIITITSSFEPILRGEWVKPGTHIACMGTDTKGKQEVDAALVTAARLFTDEVAQSISIGEAQHAVAAGLVAEADITPLGDVINGIHPGRANDNEITLFDGTGVGLQDLAVAEAAMRKAVSGGRASVVGGTYPAKGGRPS